LNLNELQRRAREGDKSAENLLFQILTERFRVFAKRSSIWSDEDCNEVAQEAVMTVLEKYKSEEFSTSFAGWAHKILKNKILNFSTKARRRKDILADKFNKSTNKYVSIPESDMEKRLLDCFGKLYRKNNLYARVINLSYQGFGAREICDKMKLPANNFYTMLSRARSMLLHCIEKGDIK
jgi:RNA polymerase sigma factor (sigma-70 family)